MGNFIEGIFRDLLMIFGIKSKSFNDKRYLNLNQTTPQTITGGQPIQNTLTASQIVATDANKKLQTLAVATYPSLTELAFVKGVTSAIQTQINSIMAITGVTIVATGASLTPDLNTTRTYRITALDINTTINNPTGTLTDSMVLYLEITGDATPRTIAWGNLFSGTTLNTLPLITVANTKMNLGFKYDATNNYFYLLAVN